MISEPNDVVSVNFCVSLCVSISMRLYSAVSLVVRDMALYKCSLLFLVLLCTKPTLYFHKAPFFIISLRLGPLLRV